MPRRHKSPANHRAKLARLQRLVEQATEENFEARFAAYYTAWSEKPDLR